MKSMFEMGIGFGRQNHFWLGQTTLSIADRNAMLANIASEQNELAAVQSYLAAVLNPSDQLGPDASQFLSAKLEADSLYGQVNAIVAQLQSADPTQWTLTTDQSNAVNLWMNDVHLMKSIVDMHPLTAGQTPVISPTAPSYNPVGLTPSSTLPPTAPGGAKPAAAPAAIGGVPTGTLIVGGGILAAVAIIGVAIAKG